MKKFYIMFMVLSLLAPLHAVRPHSAAPGSNEAKLIKAASDRDLQVAQELLEAEVDVNVIDESNGFTPLLRHRIKLEWQIFLEAIKIERMFPQLKQLNLHLNQFRLQLQLKDQTRKILLMQQ